MARARSFLNVFGSRTRFRNQQVISSSLIAGSNRINNCQTLPVGRETASFQSVSTAVAHGRIVGYGLFGKTRQDTRPHTTVRASGAPPKGE